MSWYVSRRHWFNRITNDSNNQLRFLTKPNATPSPSSSGTSTTRSPGAKTKVASAVDNGNSSPQTRKTNSVSKTSDTTTTAESPPSKRKVTFSEETTSVSASKKGKTKENSIPNKKQEAAVGKKGRKSRAVTQDNFI